MFVLPSAALISRKAFEAVGGFDEQLCGYEDDDLFLRIFRAGYDNIYWDMPLSKWRIYVPRRPHYYARDLIIPRFGEHAIREYADAVKLGNSSAISESLAEIRFLAQYDKSLMARVLWPTCSATRLCIIATR